MSDGARSRSGGEAELSVDVVSDLGVRRASVGGIPESARRMHLGVELDVYKEEIIFKSSLNNRQFKLTETSFE